jgi:hypothetical protein
MKHVFLLVLVLPLLSFYACSQQTGTPLVTVGDVVVTDDSLEALARANPRLQGRLQTKAGRDQILDTYVEQALLYQAASKRGLDNDPLIKEKIALYTKVIIAQSLLEDELTKKTGEYYKNNSDEFEKVKIAHIYIPYKTKDKNKALGPKDQVKRDEKTALEKAAQLVAKIKADAGQFEKKVEKESEDKRTHGRQGDLGWVTINDPRLRRWGWGALAEKAFAMDLGTISDPIQSDNGYHILKILEGKTQDPFEKVEARIRFKIQGQVKSALVEELKKDFKVTYHDNSEAVKGEPTKVPQDNLSKGAKAEDKPAG